MKDFEGWRWSFPGFGFLMISKTGQLDHTVLEPIESLIDEFNLKWKFLFELPKLNLSC